jgi:type IV pilus assembly protein PilC
VALYSYKAMNAEGRIIPGRLDANNPVDLELRLKRMGLDFIKGSPIKQSGLFAGRKASRRDLINFCFHLEQLIRSGVSILDGLADLRDSLENQNFRAAVASMIESIEGGRTLSQAMAEQPRIFDSVFVSLVAAGESAGKLQEVLARLVEALKWQDELAAQTRKLIMYPAFTGTVVLAVVVFMLLYLVPKMTGFIKSMGHELPLHTRILIATSNVFIDYWYLVFGLPLAAAIGLTFLARANTRVRYRLDAFRLRLPMVGNILRKLILWRFAETFAMMYASGISILESLRATQDVVDNRVIKAGLEQVSAMIAEGQGITAAFQNAGMFPPLVLRMLRVGENTGALDAALTNVSYFYSRDVRESISKLQVLIEPALTVFLGLVLGWVMLSVLGPIYDTITSLRI